jgi:hypothetical protein
MRLTPKATKHRSIDSGFLPRMYRRDRGPRRRTAFVVSAAEFESPSRAVSEMLNKDSSGQVVLLEHSRLQGGTPGPKRSDESVRLRLHDKVDMCGSVRPEAHIDLRGTREAPDHGTRAAQERSRLGSLVRRQVRYAYHVTRRFDHKGANAKRSDTVLNPPMHGVMDQTSWEVAAPLG